MEITSITDVLVTPGRNDHQFKRTHIPNLTAVLTIVKQAVRLLSFVTPRD